jgi:putative DNA primase/helicase
MTEKDEYKFTMDADKLIGKVRSSPGNPYDVAAEFIAEWMGERLVWRGDFYDYTGSHWAIKDTEDIMSEINRELGGSITEIIKDGKSRMVKWSPNNSSLANLKTQLMLQAALPSTREPDHGDGRYVFLPEGRWNIETKELEKHDPTVFNLHASPVHYDEGAHCPEFFKFLDETFGGNQDAIDLHGYWMAYELLGATDLQKYYLLLGETRSGKGTAMAINDALIGIEQSTSVSLSDFGKNFGLSLLIGKSVCRISDAQDVDQKDARAAVQRLKSITGEDRVMLDRKNKDPWVGQLGVRFTIETNTELALPDASGVVIDRAIMNRTFGSHKDSVDTGLKKRIIENEMSGILNWVLTFVPKVYGDWPVNERAMETRRYMKAASQPLREWVEETGLVVGPAYQMPRAEAYESYVDWAHTNGQRPDSAAWFARKLRAYIPGLEDAKPLIDGKQVRVYRGLGPLESGLMERDRQADRANRQAIGMFAEDVI